MTLVFNDRLIEIEARLFLPTLVTVRKTTPKVWCFVTEISCHLKTGGFSTGPRSHAARR
jgi:hypothetical protein